MVAGAATLPLSEPNRSLYKQPLGEETTKAPVAGSCRLGRIALKSMTPGFLATITREPASDLSLGPLASSPALRAAIQRLGVCS